MAACPVEECRFIVSVQAEDESDLDQAALAAFEDHCYRKHPGIPVHLEGTHSHYPAANTVRLLN